MGSGGRTARLGLRLSEEEHAKLVAMARAEGVGVSEFVRRRALNEAPSSADSARTGAKNGGESHRAVLNEGPFSADFARFGASAGAGGVSNSAWSRWRAQRFELMRVREELERCELSGASGVRPAQVSGWREVIEGCVSALDEALDGGR